MEDLCKTSAHLHKPVTRRLVEMTAISRVPRDPRYYAILGFALLNQAWMVVSLSLQNKVEAVDGWAQTLLDQYCYAPQPLPRDPEQ